MRTRSGVPFNMVLAMLLLAVSAAAAGQSWEEGLEAFAAGDFETALETFEALRDAGLDGPAVHYNVAVCEYKTRRYPEAETTFVLIRDRYPKLAGLAEYNLGLVARKLDRPEQALSHFRRAYDASVGDETLRTMAAEMIYRLTPDAVSNARRGYAGLGVRAGYDDNVALRDELGLPAGTTSESPLFDAYVAGELPLTKGGRLALDGIVYMVRYTDTPDFNQDVVEGGLLFRQDLGAWRLELSAQASYGRLAGDSFDRGPVFSAAIDRRLSGTASARLSYEHKDVSASGNSYAGIDGTRDRIEVRYRWGSETQTVVVRLQMESNDRLDAGVSPDRLGARISWRHHAGEAWSYEVGAGWRRSDYDGLADARNEDRLTLRLGATRSLGGGWMASLFYEYGNNESSDPLFSYGRNQLTVGVQRVF